MPGGLTSPPEDRTFSSRVTFVWCLLLSRCAGPDGYPDNMDVATTTPLLP